MSFCIKAPWGRVTPCSTVPGMASSLILGSHEWECSEQGLGDTDTPLREQLQVSRSPHCTPLKLRSQRLHPSRAQFCSPGDLWGSPRPQLFPSRVDGFVLMAGYFFPPFFFFFAHVSQKNHKFQAVKSRCISSLRNEVILNVTKVSLIHPGRFLLPSPKL